MTTPIDALAKIVGSRSELARILDVTRQSVSRWEKMAANGGPSRGQRIYRGLGHMPTEYNAALLAWAKRNDVPQRRIAVHLDKKGRKNGAK